jgi:hypothetical protein
MCNVYVNKATCRVGASLRVQRAMSEILQTIKSTAAPARALVLLVSNDDAVSTERQGQENS